MVLIDYVEGCLDICDEHLSVFNIDAELSLDCIMNVHACLDVDVTTLIVPVSIEANWDALKFLMVVRSSDRDPTV